MVCYLRSDAVSDDEGQTEVYTESVWYDLDKRVHVGAHRIHVCDLGPLGLIMGNTCASGAKRCANCANISKSIQGKTKLGCFMLKQLKQSNLPFPSNRTI